MWYLLSSVTEDPECDIDHTNSYWNLQHPGGRLKNTNIPTHSWINWVIGDNEPKSMNYTI